MNAQHLLHIFRAMRSPILQAGASTTLCIALLFFHDVHIFRMFVIAVVFVASIGRQAFYSALKRIFTGLLPCLVILLMLLISLPNRWTDAKAQQRSARTIENTEKSVLNANSCGWCSKNSLSPILLSKKSKFPFS